MDPSIPLFLRPSSRPPLLRPLPRHSRSRQGSHEFSVRSVRSLTAAHHGSFSRLRESQSLAPVLRLTASASSICIHTSVRPLLPTPTVPTASAASAPSACRPPAASAAPPAPHTTGLAARTTARSSSHAARDASTPAAVDIPSGSVASTDRSHKGQGYSAFAAAERGVQGRRFKREKILASDPLLPAINLLMTLLTSGPAWMLSNSPNEPVCAAMATK